ncbi:MAG: hypothetical protein NT149_02050 [Candidatus Gottesmanbacteria bacterium]|nr:hypothetical protein [Candidatus Gottesmanbacteria bacterium]
MSVFEKIRQGREKSIANQAVKDFVPFAQSVLEQGFPDVSADSFQKALSSVAGLPPAYLEKRGVTSGTVILNEITHMEHHKDPGYVNYPVKIMEYKNLNGHEVDVWIILRQDRYDARIFSREPHNTIGNTYFRKFRQHGATWYPVEPPSR